jgi:hypothetical protein
MWEYRFDEPDADWATASGSLDWLTAPAPFGNTRERNTDLQHGNRELWLRRSFELSAVPTGRIKLRLRVGGSARVILNGVELADVPDWHGFDEDYIEIDCTDQAAEALSPGANVLAVRYVNSGSNSLIDAGLHAVQEDLYGNILDQLIEQNPENLRLVETRAKRHVRDERYLEAAHDYARFALAWKGSPHVHTLNTAALFALGGDVNVYRSYCESQIKRLANLETSASSRYFPEGLTKSCLLLPGVIPKRQLPIATVHDFAAGLSPRDRLHGFHSATLALAAIRAGIFNKADKRLTMVERNIDAMPPEVSGMIHTLRAMSLLGSDREFRNEDRIKEAIRQSREAVDSQRILRHPDGTLVGCSLFGNEGNLKHNAIIAELLRREAEQLLRRSDLSPPAPER